MHIQKKLEEQSNTKTTRETMKEKGEHDKST